MSVCFTRSSDLGFNFSYKHFVTSANITVFASTIIVIFIQGASSTDPFKKLSVIYLRQNKKWIMCHQLWFVKTDVAGCFEEKIRSDQYIFLCILSNIRNTCVVNFVGEIGYEVNCEDVLETPTDSHTAYNWRDHRRQWSWSNKWHTRIASFSIYLMLLQF